VTAPSSNATYGANFIPKGGASDVFGDMNRSMAQAKFSFLEETGRTMMAVSSFCRRFGEHRARL
jgi:hypothetical protein